MTQSRSVARLEPKKKAKKMEEEPHELLLSSVVPLNAVVPQGDKNTFIMKAIKGKWSAKLFEGTGQKIEKINGNSIRVIVDQSQRKEAGAEEIDLKPFLSSNVYLDSDDLLIQKLAKKAKMPLMQSSLTTTCFLHLLILKKQWPAQPCCTRHAEATLFSTQWFLVCQTTPVMHTSLTVKL